MRWCVTSPPRYQQRQRHNIADSTRLFTFRASFKFCYLLSSKRRGTRSRALRNRPCWHSGAAFSGQFGMLRLPVSSDSSRQGLERLRVKLVNRHDDWYNRNQVVLCSKISSSKEFKNGAPRICDAQRTHGTKSRCGGWDTFLHTLDHQSVTDLDIYSQLGTFGCECDQSF